MGRKGGSGISGGGGGGASPSESRLNGMHEGGTGGRMIQVSQSEWQGSNANGAYAAVTKLPSNLMTMNKEQLQEVARGLGEPNRAVDGVGKRALVNTINSHGTNIYRVARTDSIGASISDWQRPLFATSRDEALTYARSWLRSNRG